MPVLVAVLAIFASLGIGAGVAGIGALLNLILIDAAGSDKGDNTSSSIPERAVDQSNQSLGFNTRGIGRVGNGVDKPRNSVVQ